MAELSFDKVDKAFQFLANDKTGQASLKAFGEALAQLSGHLSDLNEFEAQYVASALVQQRTGVQGQITRPSNDAKEVHGFVIKSAVKV